MTTARIASNLKLAETKQASLRKSLENLRAQADSLLALCSHLKEVQDHFDSISNSLRTEFQKLESRLADLNAKESSFDSEMGSKAVELQKVVRGVEQGKTFLHSLQLSIQLKENRFGELQKLVKDKELEYSNTQERLKERLRFVETKERQLSAVQAKIEDRWKEFDSKDEQIRAKQALIEEYDLQIRMKEQKLGLLEKLIVENSNVVESKIKDFSSLAKSVKEWEEQVELKEMEIQRWVEKLEKQYESKVEQLNLIDNKVKDCLSEVQLREQHLETREELLDSLDKSIQEQVRRIEQAKELELKQQKFYRIGKSTDDDTPKQPLQERTDILHSQMKIEQLECIPVNTAVISTSIQSSINKDSKSLQFFMNEYFKRTDFVYSEVSACLQRASDPEKLVLDSMQGFYPSPSDLNVENREFGFDISVVRRSCVHLLKELKRISPKINGQVREDAKKLAADWRTKMTVDAENWLDVLGFLWLLTAYNLTSTYDPKELESLRRIAALHDPSAVMCGVLDIADTAHANSNKSFPVKTEKPECSLEKNAAKFSTQNAELTATTDAPDAIPNLIGKKQLIEAVRVICTFNLSDKFPPVPLLKEYVEDARKRCWYSKEQPLEEKDKVVDEQIADLRRVIQCITDCKLESVYPAGDIEKLVSKLQRIKNNWRHCAARPASRVEQEHKQGKKRSSSTFSPKFQAKQHKSNCQLTAATPNALPTPNPGYLQSSSPPFRCENYGKDLARGNCFHCNGSGHWKRNCPRYLSESKNVNLNNNKRLAI